MIKTVYFDIGNVLVFFSRQKMMAQMAACSGLSIEELQNLLFGNHLLERYETGKITTEEVYRIFHSHSRRAFSLPEMLDAASNIFTPNTELWPIVESLKKAHVRIILLSNISECHFHKIVSDYPILRQFDHKILSYEVGACKPHPTIFQKALSHSNCKPEECFYTDDIPEFITGARKAGLPGEIYKDVPTLRSHLTARGCQL